MMTRDVYWSTGALVILSIKPMRTEAGRIEEGAQTRADFEEVILMCQKWRNCILSKNIAHREKKGGLNVFRKPEWIPTDIWTNRNKSRSILRKQIVMNAGEDMSKRKAICILLMGM